MFRAAVAFMFAILILLVNLTSPAQAEIENRYDSESIGVFEYIGCEHKNWANPVKAKFRPIKMLKGPRYGRDISIHYGFHPKNTKYSMPNRGSMWILFIPVAIPTAGMFETFHGSEGRIVWSEEAHQKVVTDIQN
ncbi:hypothetical protein KBI23_16630 [bacterium]|nr:hypothetical protein [bacterium]MBP9807576.1 hypothetical protein [bacterium]